MLVMCWWYVGGRLVCRGSKGSTTASADGWSQATRAPSSAGLGTTYPVRISTQGRYYINNMRRELSMIFILEG